MVIKAMVFALALVAAQGAQAQHGDDMAVSNPATVRRADVKSISVIVPDCERWQTFASCAVVARPPEICVMDQPGAARIFDILSAAAAAPRRRAPRRSDYATARILMRLTGARIAIAEVPLHPELEAGGRSHLWISYGARRVWLSRARWNEIARLAQSYQCARQPRQWGAGM